MGNGYGGEIRIICGVDPDGVIIRVATLEQSETKGLGTVITEEWFTGQFNGADSGLEGVSTVSGATISTRAFVNAVRSALEAFEQIREAG